MKIKSVWLFAVVIILLIVAAIFFLNDGNSSIKTKEKDFAILQPEKITSIKIKYDSLEVSLEKDGKSWKVNESFEAKRESIGLILTTLQRLEVLSPISKDYQDIAQKKLKNDPIEVTIGENNRVSKIFYVQYDSIILNGTVMMLKGADRPFIVKIKGYPVKDLTKIFTVDSRFWRNNTFNFYADEISRIELIYPGEPEKSFVIKQQNAKPAVSSLTNDLPEDKIDYEEVSDYLQFFTNIKFRYPQNTYELNLKFADIRVITSEGETFNLQFYRKPLAGSEKYDLNLCYGLINNEKEPVEIFYTDIDPVLKELNDFTKK